MNFLLFSCPIFLGHTEASGFCFQGERLLYGREPNAVEGGTGKAAAAKLPDAGIGPKQCPGNERQKKTCLPDSVRIELRNRLRQS